MDDYFDAILEHLTSKTSDLYVIQILGMCIISKKTLAKKVYDDYIFSKYDKNAWVTIFKDYDERQMLLEVVSTITGIN